MEILEVLDLEEVRKKALPYIPTFLFGYGFILERKIVFFVFLIISLFVGACIWVLKEDAVTNRMAYLLYSDKEDKKMVAKEVGKTKFIPFLIKSFMGVFQFILLVASSIIAIIFLFKEYNNIWFSIVWMMFAIVGIISLFYLVMVLLKKRKRLQEVVNLIKNS